jgi:flagellar basal body-associated protein FliL
MGGRTLGGKGTFLIMLIVIVILVVTIAVLTMFIFYGGMTGLGGTANPGATVANMPKDGELGFINLFKEGKYCNLKPDEENPSPILQVDITLYYYKKIRGIKNVEEKINQYGSKTRELVGLYFQEKTLTEIKENNFWTEAKEELKREINKLLTENEKNKDDIIYEVVFESWNYQ